MFLTTTHSQTLNRHDGGAKNFPNRKHAAVRLLLTAACLLGLLFASPDPAEGQTPTGVLLLGAPPDYNTVQGVVEGALVTLQYRVTLSAPAPDGGWRGRISFGSNCGGDTTTASASDYRVTGFEGADAETQILVLKGQTAANSQPFNFQAIADSVLSEPTEFVIICLYDSQGRYQSRAQVIIAEQQCRPHEYTPPGGGCRQRPTSHFKFTVENNFLSEGDNTLITVTPVRPLSDYPIRCQWGYGSATHKATLNWDYTVSGCGTQIRVTARKDGDDTEENIETIGLQISQGNIVYGKSPAIRISPRKRSSGVEACPALTTGYVGQEMTVGLSMYWNENTRTTRLKATRENNRPSWQGNERTWVYSYTSTKENSVYNWRRSSGSTRQSYGWPRNYSDPTLNPGRWSSGDYVWVRDRGNRFRYSAYHGFNPPDRSPTNTPPLPGARFYQTYNRDISIYTWRNEKTIHDSFLRLPWMKWSPKSGGVFSFQESYRGREWHTCRFRIYDTVVTLSPRYVAENAGATRVKVTARLLEETLPSVPAIVYFNVGPGTARSSDYSLSYGGTTGSVIKGSIVVPAGRREASAVFTLTPVDDIWHEGTETLSFNVSSPGRLAYTRQRPLISDNDAAPSIKSVRFAGTLSEYSPGRRNVSFVIEVGEGREEGKPNVEARVGINPSQGRVTVGAQKLNYWSCSSNRRTGPILGGNWGASSYIMANFDISWLPVAYTGGPCPRWSTPVIRGTAGLGQSTIIVHAPVNVRNDGWRECGEHVRFTVWMPGYGGDRQLYVPIEDDDCAIITMDGPTSITEGESAQFTIKIDSRFPTRFRVLAYHCRVPFATTNNVHHRCYRPGPHGWYSNWQYQIESGLTAPTYRLWFRENKEYSDYSDRWIWPVRNSCTERGGSYTKTINVVDDDFIQGSDRYVYLRAVWADSWMGGRCKRPYASAYIGRIRIVDNDSPIVLNHTHTTREFGDDPDVTETRCFQIAPDDAPPELDLSNFVGISVRSYDDWNFINAGPPRHHRVSTGEKTVSNSDGVWSVNRWEKGRLCLDIGGDLDDHNNTAVFYLSPRQARVGFGTPREDLRVLLDSSSRKITINIQDDDTGLPAWGVSCSRYWGEGLDAVWTSQSYTETGDYTLRALSWKKDVLTVFPASSATATGWSGSVVWNDGGISRRVRVSANNSRLEMTVTPQPVNNFVLRLVSGSKVLIAATADGESMVGGGWRWNMNDLFPSTYGRPFVSGGGAWSASLYEASHPGGLVPAVSGTGSAAVVTLSGKPTGKGNWVMSVRPFEGGVPLLQKRGGVVEMVCSHNVERPAWDPSLLPSEWGGVCEVWGTAARSGVRLHPTASPPAYPYPEAGFAPHPRNVRWSADPRGLGSSPPVGTARWGMTASSSGWAGNPGRQLLAELMWQMEDRDGNVLRGRDAAGVLVDVRIPCVLRIGAPALSGGGCSVLAGTGVAVSGRVLGYGTYVGGWVAEDVWVPVVPSGVRLARSGDVLLLAGSTPDPGRWALRLRLTDPEGVALVSRSQDGTWAPVTTFCDLRAVDLNGAIPPGGAIRPAVKIGPSCAVPGDSWEVRLRKQGEAGTPQTIWDDFVTPAVTDPARLIFWYPYPATLRGDWLAPWEKPLPGPGQTHYPTSGEFNDPYQDSSSSDWTASRYSRLMTEAWDTYFPEYPLTP